MSIIFRFVDLINVVPDIDKLNTMTATKELFIPDPPFYLLGESGTCNSLICWTPSQKSSKFIFPLPSGSRICIIPTIFWNENKSESYIFSDTIGIAYFLCINICLQIEHYCDRVNYKYWNNFTTEVEKWISHAKILSNWILMLFHKLTPPNISTSISWHKNLKSIWNILTSCLHMWTVNHIWREINK